MNIYLLLTRLKVALLKIVPVRRLRFIASTTLLPFPLHQFVTEPLRLMLKTILQMLPIYVLVRCDRLRPYVLSLQLKVRVHGMTRPARICVCYLGKMQFM